MNLNFVFKFSSVLGAAALVVGCAATRPLPVAGPEDVTRGSRHFPDLTSDELVAGRALFASRCGACHAPPAPGSRPAIEWPKEIHEMRERARLSEKDMQLIERYVVTMSEGSVAKAR